VLIFKSTCYKSQAIICMHDCLTRFAMHVLKINKQDFSSANADDSQCSHLAVLLEAWRINRNDIDDCPKGSRSRSREHKNLRSLQNSHRILENFTRKHSKTLSNDIQCSMFSVNPRLMKLRSTDTIGSITLIRTVGSG